jgi:type I restriction enzyme S subunit
MDAPAAFQHWIPARLFDSARLDARFYGPEHIGLLSKLRQSGIPTSPLGELVKHLAHVTGYESTKYMEFVDDPTGVKVVEAMNVGDLLIDSTEWKRIPREGYEALTRHQLAKEDLVFSKDGTLGNCAIVSASFLPAVASRHVFRIVPRPKQVDCCYLAAVLTSNVGRIQTTYRQAGAIQGTIITPEVSAFRIPLPSDNIQRAIGNKVRKAERLRELEEAANESFAIWMSAASCESMLASTVRRFLEHSPDSTCADGVWIADIGTADRIDPWPHHVAPRVIRKHLEQVGKALPLSNFLNVVSAERESVASDSLAEGEYHISVLDVDPSGAVNWDKALTTRYDGNGVRVEPGDILYSCLNPKEARACVVPRECRARMIASLEFGVLRPTAAYDSIAHLVAAVLRSNWVRVQASFLTRSSSLSRRRLQEEDLLKVLIPWKDDQTVELNGAMAAATGAREEAAHLVTRAKADVESVIDGTLDDGRLLAESAEIETWLRKNPSPHAAARTRGESSET